MPSRYEEILPLAALEAMAAGLPVVAARAGGLAEIVPAEGSTRAATRRAGRAIPRLYGSPEARGARLAVVRARARRVAAALRSVYDGVGTRRTR